MESEQGLDRRRFLGGAAALGAAGLVGGAAAAEAQSGKGRRGRGRKGGRRKGRGRRGLPRRKDFVVRNAHVLTMDPQLGEMANADVHVRDGEIVAVGRNLRAGAREIDGSGKIVLPGLIDTHWHLWTTLYRSLASSSQANAYFPLNVRYGSKFEPRDIYAGARLALADALSSGITTVHDWSHNIRGPKYADANLQAHVDVGLRGRFSYGPPQGHPLDKTIDLADLRRVKREWFDGGRAELLHLGLAGRPPGLAPESVYKAEWDTAKELGLPVSYHANSNRQQGDAQMIRQLGEKGMLGPDTQLIHALYTTEEERRMIVESGASVSLSPWSELLIGYGVTTVRELTTAGALVNLSVDTLPLTGTADMFSIIRLTLGLDRGQATSEFSSSALRVLEMATIDAAEGLGIDEVTGSLTPGKRADLIMVRTNDVNIAPFTHAPNMIALAAQPQNVDTVVVDGRILKRRGRLTALDSRRVVADAKASLAAVEARVEASPALAAGAARLDPTQCCE